jgi:hypothetical protein
MTPKASKSGWDARQVWSNRHSARALRLFVALVALMAVTTAAHAEAPNESADASAPWPWAASGRAQVMYGEHGAGGGGALQVTRAITGNARFGGAFLAVPVTSNREGECRYHYRCFYSFYELAPVIELHAFPAFVVDPWVRGAIGAAIMGPSNQSGNRGALVTVVASAEVGITFRVWHVTIGPYAGIAVFSASNGFAVVPGAQIGAEW